MAKIKVKKESVFKLRFTEHSGEEWKAWENFCFDLVEILTPEGSWIDLGHKDQGLIWLHCGTAEKRINKADIIKISQKHNIEIEFEEEEKKKEEKWVPIHKTIAELLKEDSDRNTEPCAELYARGTKAPKQGIPDILKHFESVLPRSGGHLHEILEKAIQNLKQQQKEG